MTDENRTVVLFPIATRDRDTIIGFIEGLIARPLTSDQRSAADVNFPQAIEREPTTVRDVVEAWKRNAVLRPLADEMAKYLLVE